ncbi:WhiB family transcriptional regulator [Streptomyces sp. PD-S100-1]|uniref:WhiB family transcriptional regulator n=1 Tax=Streptomyces sp. PD-S100-1 TaxID=3394351 RepID=UPI0039BCB9AE
MRAVQGRAAGGGQALPAARDVRRCPGGGGVTAVGPRRDAGAARDWQLYAACRAEDTEVFFREAGRAKARKLCGGCAVWASCLNSVMASEDGLSAGYRHGIFAGMTGPERAALARSRAARAREEAAGSGPARSDR